MSRHERDDWTRAESRYVDGELAPAASRRVDERLAGDPACARRIEGWREAMDLWREDAARAAVGLDPRVLADRVRRDGARSVPVQEARIARLSRRYAAAAVILMGIGVGGAAWLGPQPRRTEGGVRAAIRGLEQERLDVTVEGEWQRFGPSLETPADGER